jgi:hypothetical protein
MKIIALLACVMWLYACVMAGVEQHKARKQRKGRNA